MMKRFGKTVAHLLGRTHAEDTAPTPQTEAPVATPPDSAPATTPPVAPTPPPAAVSPEVASAPDLPTAAPTVADAVADAVTAPPDSTPPAAEPLAPPVSPTSSPPAPVVAEASATQVDASDEDDEDDEDDSDEDENAEEASESDQPSERVFFGEEVFGASARHRAAAPEPARLARFGLPEIPSERALADWLGIPLGQLRWYTQDRPADTTWHYVRSTVPKRGGGERVILAPKRALKALQRKVLADIVVRVPTATAAHGFVRGHSIVTNARQHVGKAAVLKLDLKDFFPSITFPRVRGLFIVLGYSFSVASTLALLCTEHDREPFDRDGTRYHISIGPRHLVQGAPTSPGLANLVAWRLDRRLAGLAAKHALTYTRYADDLTFSGDDFEALKDLRAGIQRIVRDERFSVNTAKTRLAARSARQIVTGLVVNDIVAVPRAQRRTLRALLHNARTSGLAAQNREQRPGFRAHLRGQIAHIHAANPEHAARLRASLDQVADGDA